MLITNYRLGHPQCMSNKYRSLCEKFLYIAQTDEYDILSLNHR